MATAIVARDNTHSVQWGRAALAGVVSMLVFGVVEMAFSWAIRGASPVAPLVAFGTAVLHAVAPAASVGGGRTVAAGVALLLALGVLYGVVVAALVQRIGTTRAALVGALFGLAMYAVDMYGLARAFPSLVELRDWMSALAGAIQGALVAGLYKAMAPAVVPGVRVERGHDLRDLRHARLV